MNQKQYFTTLQLTTDAMLCALCAILGFVAIDLTSIKITFESVPVLIAGLLFGPIHGLAVGAVGTLISQLIRYGFTATTVLWMLPYILCGFIVGFYTMKKKYKLTQVELIILVLVNELLITALNTGVLYIDSKLFYYYTPELITGALTLRIVITIIKSILYALILYPLILTLKKNFPFISYFREKGNTSEEHDRIRSN